MCKGSHTIHPIVSSSTSSASTVRSRYNFSGARTQTPNAARYYPVPTTSLVRKPTAVYKYIRGTEGVVGSITDPSGVDSTIHEDIENIIGTMRAQYLDVHGYRKEAVEVIIDAYQSANTAEDFVALAGGCGMAVVELEWFWELSNCCL